MGTIYNVSSGKSSSGITLYDSDRMFVMSGGKVSDITVNPDAILTINSGASGTQIRENGGAVDVAEGTVVTFASNTFSNMTLYDSSTYHRATLHSGTTAVDTIVGKNGNLFVSSGGTATGTMIRQYGKVYVEVGGSMTSTTLDFLGEISLGFGARATGNTINGDLMVSSGGTAVSNTIGAGGEINVYSGGHVISTDVSGGFLTVLIGAKASNTTVNSGGNLDVSSGGTAVYTEVNSGGIFTVYAGGRASNTDVNSGGDFRISAGGSASNTTLSSGAVFEIASGTTADLITVRSGAVMNIKSDGLARDIVESGGYVSEEDGALVTYMINTFSGVVLDYISATVHWNTTADKTTVRNHGELEVFSGGLTNNTVVSDTGTLTVYGSGIASATTVNDYGKIYLLGGSARSTNVSSDGRVHVSSGGQLDTATVFDSGYLYVSSGGQANNVTVSSGGYFSVTSGTAYKTSLYGGTTGSQGGHLLVSAQALAHSTTVFEGGRLTVQSGGNANSTTVSSGGTMMIRSGGNANSTTVSSGGSMTVISGGSATATTVSAGGILSVSAGGRLTGTLTLNNGADVTVSGTVVFNLSQATTGNTAFVNNLSLVKGAPKYTLTVSASQAEGTYRLAGGAAGFNKTITVKDTAGETIGSLTVGEAKEIEGANYELALNESVLTVSVSYDNTTFTGDLTSATKNISATMLASDVYINDDGILNILEGGSAEVIRVSSGGKFNISSGGVADIATVNSEGWLHVSEGGAADNIVVNSGGYCIVSSGGVAGSVTVFEGGQLHVLSAGSATEIRWTPCEGHVFVSDGGYATFVSEYSGVYIGSANKLLSSAAVMDNITLGFSGEMNVMSGGTALNTTVNGNARMYVSSGRADGTAVNDGFLFVSSGGTATNTTVNSGGHLYVYPSGNAYLTMVNDQGELYLRDGANALFTEVYSGGVIRLDGGKTYSATINDNGRFAIHAGTASDTTVSNGGWLDVFSGGKLTGSMTFEDGAVVSAFSGSIIDFDISALTPANSVLLNDFSVIDGIPAYTITISAATQEEGTYRLADGASAFAGTITVVNTSGESLGTLTVGNTTKIGGTDYTLELTGSSLTVTVGEGSRIITGDVKNETKDVTSGWSALDVNVLTEGILNILGGGIASDTEVEEGEMNVYSGGIASDTSVTDLSGSVNVYSGGILSGTSVRGTVSVFAGAVAEKTALGYDGLFGVYSGSAYDTTVSNGGRFEVYADGTANVFTIGEGATLAIHNGRLTGQMTFEEGAIVSVSDSVVVDFDISALGPANAAFVNDLSFLMDPLLTYTLTVSATQEEGIYRLADGAADFDRTITVVNTSGETLGTLSVAGGTQVIGGTEYTLVPDGSILTVEIGEGGSTVITGDITGETKAVTSGWSAVDVNVNSDGILNILGGGIAINTKVNDDGKMNVYSGGIASNTTVNQYGRLTVSSGGVASNTTVNQYGMLTVSSGGTVSGVTVSSGGNMDVDGTADDITFTGGQLWVYGTATNLAWTPCEGTLYNNGYVTFTSSYSGVYFGSKGKLLENSATMDGRTLDDYYYEMYVMDGGIATNTTLNGGYVYVWSNGIASNTAINNGFLYVSSGGTAVDTTVANGGYFFVNSGGVASNVTVEFDSFFQLYEGGKVTGIVTLADDEYIQATNGGIIDFDISALGPDNAALINRLSVGGVPFYTLTVGGTQANGTYKLAGGATGFSKTISVVNTSGSELGSLTVGETVIIGGADYTLNLDGDNVLSVSVNGAVMASAKSDIDGNGISDVLFVWTGEHGEGNYQHGYWMNGTSEWQSANTGHPTNWDNLGNFDMTGDGKADSVLFGNVDAYEVPSAYIGYYKDGIDTDENWVTIGFLTNAAGIAWQNKVGNMTGNESGVNSIAWYAPELGSVGVWTDGTENWVQLNGAFMDGWTLAGIGDFDGDGKDSVVMSYNGGQFLYTVGIGDEAPTSLGSANWSGWDLRAIGDFSGDGKDDIILFHKEFGAMAMLVDGNADSYTSIGQLDASDWFVVGAGDYDGDQKDDLLVRQYSTGMLGYYSGGNMNAWVEMGRGVDMSWSVIA